jgi:hypothetical protein
MELPMRAATQSPSIRGLIEVMGGKPTLAARHGLSAFVADELARLGLPIPPPMAEDARAQVAAGLRIRTLSLAVIDILARRGIIPVMLKGYALASRLYPEQPLGRPSSDVDVLIPGERLGDAATALSALGLKRQEDPSLENPFEEHHHLSFHGPIGLVEVHFRLFTGFGGGCFDDKAVLQRALPAVLEGRAIRLLAPEDEFVYLATHAANHAFLRASWLVDLERYLHTSPGLDWNVMGTRARASGFSSAVAASLSALERLMGVALPPSATRAFPVPWGRRLVDRWLFSPQRLIAANLSSNHLASFLLRFWLVDSPAHGARHLVDGARRLRRRHLMEK